ncbi:ABC transporter substrate-binding protein [Bradyrhizobium sp. CCBAU 51765]|uniref:ABC transporter substrate-binding protein n=1 Tax=Bradyrhizobium sp. CCBAU 51765 TaxID=1325102 RepID=UPI001889BDF5|nr:ABC transporter substrate-binding protein [Bradyrhizobium sp. CCBAU 51765]QOZ11819.1 ABC transporter substrate-binding protein [Bradyrhizobium sp. CCBAU 51765]
MTIRLNRRAFMAATSSAVVAPTLISCAGRAYAQRAGELRIVSLGGGFGKAVTEAYLKPFQAETGIKVVPITQDLDVAQVGLMVQSKNVLVDVGLSNQASALTLAASGHLEEVDYSIYSKDELSAVESYSKHKNAFSSYIYSTNMVYNTKKYPTGKPRPTTWAEYWDVAKFPGSRALHTGEFGSEGPWEEALLANGVSKDALYPIDIDRAFASLDRIKPHVRKWWTNGSEVLQIMRDNVADIVQSYDGRALSLVDAGEPLEINRNQAKLTWDYWYILKGSPNAGNAQKFIEFTSRPGPQAEFARLYAQAPSNRNAYKLLTETVAKKLATYPDYLAGSFPLNVSWYNEVGKDGLSNRQRLAQRWNEWILR